MSKPAQGPVHVEFAILDRHYKVSCLSEQQGLLLEAARELDRRMREVRGQGEGVGPEKAAVMVGLNAVFEMLEQKAASGWDVTDVKRRIKGVEDRLDRCFFEQESLF